MKKAFTLIELLVVVLIIGILAAIALPQYEKAVEKSRLAEALINIKYIKNGIEAYILENGQCPYDDGPERNICALDLVAPELKSSAYFNYSETPYSSYGSFQIDRYVNGVGDLYEMRVQRNSDGSWTHRCYTWETNVGRTICKGLESEGYTYIDDQD